METLTKANIRRGKTEIDVPYKDETISFIYPAIGPGTYQNTMSQISEQGLLRPTSSQLVSLIHSALIDKDEPEFKDVLAKLRNNYLWTSTENLYVPEGVFVYDNIDGKMVHTKDELTNLLNAKDEKVRFVETGFKTGSQSISDFVENPYVRAHFGEELSDLVLKVADSFKLKPYVWTLENVKDEKRRYSALGAGWYDGRFFLYGGCHDGYYYGFVFGVSNTGEASRTQK